MALGTLAATEQPLEYGYDPSRGPYTIRRWKGGMTQIQSLGAAYRSLGWSTRILDGYGGTSTLEVTVGNDPNGTGQEITDTWEFYPGKGDIDLLEADLGIINDLTADNIFAIRQYMEKTREGTAIDETQFPDTPSGARAKSLVVVKLLLAGIKSHPVEQPTIRHSWMIPPGGNFVVSTVNIGKIHSYATLISSAGVPADIRWAISGFASGSVSRSGIALNYGWLKHAPHFTRASWQRREVVQEHEFGLWSNDVWGAVI